jgi:predicted secreted protein
MPVATGLAIFFLIWWVVLFAVLPWGISSQHESQDPGHSLVQGTDPGAPIKAKIGWKLLWTTLVAAVIYAICYVVYVEHWITIDGLMGAFSKAS